jgi:hypothetical protein
MPQARDERRHIQGIQLLGASAQQVILQYTNDTSLILREYI